MLFRHHPSSVYINSGILVPTTYQYYYIKYIIIIHIYKFYGSIILLMKKEEDFYTIFNLKTKNKKR